MMLRRYSFKLYPGAAQEAALRDQLRMLGELWNALLQRREDVYRREGRTLGKREQYKEITNLRAECPEWAALSVAAARGVADRLDKAFKAFFRRAKQGAGAQSGYPRYKRSADWSSISFTEACGSGWNISRARAYAPRSQKPAGGWTVYVKGVPGVMKARGRLPAEPLDWRTGEILWRDGTWWLSIAVEMAARRTPGLEQIQITFDLIDEFARVERAIGESLAGSQEQITPQSQRDTSHPPVDTPDLGGDENQRNAHNVGHLPVDTPDLGGDENPFRQVPLSARPVDTPDLGGDENPGVGITIGPIDTPNYRKYSWRWKREKQRLARQQAVLARQRKHQQHLWTTAIVNRSSDLTVIAPPIKESTASARGDEKSWGACVSTVSTLNRHILGQAPAQAIAMLAYKAEEAGIRFDHVTVEPISVGRDLVKAGKLERRAKRQIKEAA